MPGSPASRRVRRGSASSHDRVADRPNGPGVRLVAEVGVDVHVAGRQRDRLRRLAVQRPVRVARLRVTRRRGRDAHHVRARRQAVEDVVAGRVGRRGRRHHVIARAEEAVRSRRDQLDAHAAQARLVRVLHPVAVRIAPHPVADRARAGVARHVARRRPVVAEVRRQVLLRRTSARHRRRVRRARAVLVVGRVRRQARPAASSGQHVTVQLPGARPVKT